MKKPKSDRIPVNPGCYLMKDKKNKIIYIGKAKNLRKRVLSYYRKNKDDKIRELVKTIEDIEYIITDNEVEALILEAKLIRKHKPIFNISLKDSVRYAYIQITKEKFPRIISTREINRKKDTFFGPYPDGTARKETVYFLNKIFKLRTCKKLPKNVCLLYHINQCSGPCEKHISKEDYIKNIEKATLVLKGKTKKVIELLKKEMKRQSKEQNYENAKSLRDQIYALENISIKQKVSLKKSYNQDFINYIKASDKIYIQLFNVNKGIISAKKQFEFDLQKASFQSFIKQYYFNNEIPQEIIIPKEIPEQDQIEKYLILLKKSNVKITIPQKGTKKELLNLLTKNIETKLSFDDKILLELKESLTLQTIPRHIECFDISNIGKNFTVGAMVHFKDGKPDKNNYRHFKIRTVKGQDDYAMMAEIVKRRYSRLIKEKQQLPDLIVIDGGKGQLHVAFQILEDLKISIPIIGLAKKFEEIYFVGAHRPLRLSKKSESLKILQRIRDEAHRFGIKYHRLLRSKGMLK